MNDMENIFICLIAPCLLLFAFVERATRKHLSFVLIGMAMSLLSSYLNQFFMVCLDADVRMVSVEIAPICEEVGRSFPLVLWIFLTRPKKEEILPSSLFLAVGFATFENVCYLIQNGATNYQYLLLRGCSAGAVHILCGLALGYGLTWLFSRPWLAAIGTMAVIGGCSVFHGIYNLLCTADGWQKIIGYALPTSIIAMVAVIRFGLKKEKERAFRMQEIELEK